MGQDCYLLQTNFSLYSYLEMFNSVFIKYSPLYVMPFCCSCLSFMLIVVFSNTKREITTYSSKFVISHHLRYWNFHSPISAPSTCWMAGEWGWWILCIAVTTLSLPKNCLGPSQSKILGFPLNSDTGHIFSFPFQNLPYYNFPLDKDSRFQTVFSKNMNFQIFSKRVEWV